jgi:hypothetical protein
VVKLSRGARHAASHQKADDMIGRLEIMGSFALGFYAYLPSGSDMRRTKGNLFSGGRS